MIAACAMLPAAAFVPGSTSKMPCTFSNPVRTAICFLQRMPRKPACIKDRRAFSAKSRASKFHQVVATICGKLWQKRWTSKGEAGEANLLVLLTPRKRALTPADRHSVAWIYSARPAMTSPCPRKLCSKSSALPHWPVLKSAGILSNLDFSAFRDLRNA